MDTPETVTTEPAAAQATLWPDENELAEAFFTAWSEAARHQFSLFRPVHLMPWNALIGPERAAFVAGLRGLMRAMGLTE